MALRQRGKYNFYHAYFRQLEELPDGSLRRKHVTVNLYTTDLITAKALEADLMEKNRAVCRHQRSLAHAARMAAAAGRGNAAPVLEVIQKHRRRRLKICDALAAAARYRQLGVTAERHFNNFARSVPCRYMDEVTPEIAFDYLCQRFPVDDSKGKSFNNAKSAINNVFKLTLLDADLTESPFQRIPSRDNDSDHQRPFSEDEFRKLYAAAREPWKSAILIAWYTGLREKDVFSLQWHNITGDVIETTPAKTARHGRGVQIPVHPELEKLFAELPRAGERVLGAWAYNPNNSSFALYFGKLLQQCDIRENSRGIVNFNSFRNSFITRCDEAGIPRHAIRGIVGHVDDEQTDLYSHDLHTARLIQSLPATKLKLDKSRQN